MRIIKTVAALALAGVVLTGCYQNGRPGHASDHHGHGHHHDRDRDNDHRN
jgi:hypothetical protein